MTDETSKKLDGKPVLPDEELKSVSGGQNVPTLYQAYCSDPCCNFKVNCTTYEEAARYANNHTNSGDPHHHGYVRQIPHPNYI